MPLPRVASLPKGKLGRARADPRNGALPASIPAALAGMVPDRMDHPLGLSNVLFHHMYLNGDEQWIHYVCLAQGMV